MKRKQLSTQLAAIVVMMAFVVGSGNRVIEASHYRADDVTRSAGSELRSISSDASSESINLLPDKAGDNGSISISNGHSGSGTSVANKPWAIVLCKFSDQPQEPRTPDPALPPCNPATLRPYDGWAPAADYLGIWGDTGINTDRDRIVVRISDGGRAGYRVSTLERVRRFGAVRNITADGNAVWTGTMMPNYAGDHYPASPKLTPGSAGSSPPGGARNNRQGRAPAALQQGQTLVLPNHVTLELSLGCILGKSSRYYLRYFRTGDDGNMVTDVALIRSQDPPR